MKRLTIVLSAALAGSGPLLSADDEVRRPAALFGQLDANGDGELSADEIPDERAAFFERLLRVGDDDDDGRLSQSEFAAALEEPDVRAETGAREGAGIPADVNPERLFNNLDRNGDSEVSLEELPEEARRRLAPVFERLGKESLSREEFLRVREQMNRGEGRPEEGRPGREMLERLRSFDANRDGVVTREEVPEEARERFNNLLNQTGRDALNLRQLEERLAQGGPGRGGDGDRPRPEGDRPRPDFEGGDRPRPEGDRPRPEGDRPRPEGDRPRPDFEGGDRPRPEGDRPRPEGDRGPREGGMGPIFLRLVDTNRDGRLNRDELRGAIEHFEALDANGDGQLDPRELMGPPPGEREGQGRGEFGGDRPRPDGEGGERGRPEGEGGDRPRPDGEGRPGFGREGGGPPRGQGAGPREGGGRPGFGPGPGNRPRPEGDGDRPRPDGDDRPDRDRPEGDDRGPGDGDRPDGDRA